MAGPEPTPGGGSAAALSGALGAALVEMVCGMPKTKSALAQERAWLDAAGRTAKQARAKLARWWTRTPPRTTPSLRRIELPKASEAEKVKRGDGVMRRSARPPRWLETAESCLRVLEAAREAAPRLPERALRRQTGAALAWSHLFGALENVVDAAPAAWGAESLRRADALQREAQGRPARSSCSVRSGA